METIEWTASCRGKPMTEIEIEDPRKPHERINDSEFHSLDEWEES